jgi:hypothetical protein
LSKSIMRRQTWCQHETCEGSRCGSTYNRLTALVSSSYRKSIRRGSIVKQTGGLNEDGP